MAQPSIETSFPRRSRWTVHDFALLLRQRRAVVVLALLLAIFLPLSLAVRMPGMLAWDLGVTRWVQSGRNPLLDRVALAFTVGGSGLPLAVLAVGAAVALLRAGKPLAAAICVLALVTFPLNEALKLLVGRVRPDPGSVQVILPALGLSFPSGHAMSSSTVCGILAVMTWLHVPDRRLRLAGVMLLGVGAVGIGISRVYLGAHWLSDVLGGWTAGLLLMLLLTLLYRRYAPPDR